MRVPYWNTQFGENDISFISSSIKDRCIGQGKRTSLLESEIAKLLQSEQEVFVTMVSSGSMALLLSMLALGIGEDDEVIVPNYTWVATAHAPALVGAKVVPVDTLFNIPLLDANQIKKSITSKTKAIIPVHLNGRSCDMNVINSIAHDCGLFVIEDCAQAFLSSNYQGQMLGTLSDIGCFSLSMCKLISSGQGGFCVTKDPSLANKLRELRTHGLASTFSSIKWKQIGCNFRYNDILASLALSQIANVKNYTESHILTENTYKKNISHPHVRAIDRDSSYFNIPLYHEFLVDDQASWLEYLYSCGVIARPFYPCLHTADYLFDHLDPSIFPNSSFFSTRGISLPGGPHIPLDHLEYVIKVINERVS